MAESSSLRKLVAKRKAHAKKSHKSHKAKVHQDKDEKKTEKKEKKGGLKVVKVIGLDVDLPAPGSPAAIAKAEAEAAASKRSAARVLGEEQTAAPTCECAYRAGPAVLSEDDETDYVAPLMAPCGCDADGARVVNHNWVEALDVSMPDPESIAAASAVVNDDGTVNPEYKQELASAAPSAVQADDTTEDEHEELGPEYISENPSHFTPEMKETIEQNPMEVPSEENADDRLMDTSNMEYSLPWVPQYKDEAAPSDVTLSHAHNKVAEIIQSQQLDAMNAANPDHPRVEVDLHDAMDHTEVMSEAETI